MEESRTGKSLKNVRMNTICYFVSLLVAFFTRKVLLENLGTEFIGFTGTLGSLLSFLNVAELGVSTAVSYVLYKPLHDRDYPKINEIISVLGFLYRRIGIFIVCAGVIMSIFLLLIFKDTVIDVGVIYFGFYAYLSASAIGYFVNFRMILLSADQRNYIITGYFQASISAKVILQMLAAIYTGSFYLYLFFEIIFAIVNAVILQQKIGRTYPWLQANIAEGRFLFKNYPEITKYVKQIFIHKISSFVQFQLSPFLIYAFVSLPMVAIYSNYTIITQRVQGLFLGIMGSTWSGVGNLISEGDKGKIFNVYEGLMAANIFMGSLIATCFFILSTPFIRVWLGAEYELSSMIVLIISIQLFLQMVRGVNDQFINGFGLFYDIWAPVTESVLYLLFSLVLGSIYGLPGVLAGPLVSTLLIVYGWKPYFLFSRGFNLPVPMYIRVVGKNLFAAFLSIIISFSIYSHILQILPVEDSWASWIANAFFFTCILCIVSIMSFGLFSSGFRVFCKQLYLKKKQHG